MFGQKRHVVAVFCLTKMGNLILQTDRTRDYSKIIANECLKSSVQIKGVVADWELSKSIWDYLLIKQPTLKVKLSQKEVLFGIDLNATNFLPDQPANYSIRYLNTNDYPQWKSLNDAFAQELNIDQGESDNAKYKRFIDEVRANRWFGLFSNEKLLCTANFSAHVNNLGQIGNVYVLPIARKCGFAKALISQILIDGKTKKHMSKVILFTGINNQAAINLYQCLGFVRIGYFGLFLGE